MKDNLGIYIHVPFCYSKCPYCNFYSKVPKVGVIEKYKKQIKNNINSWSKRINKCVDTLYFGGGTPTILGSRALCEVKREVLNCFKTSEKLEITTEMNPELCVDFNFKELRESGFNRLSIGVQSANENELLLLGRKHTNEMVKDVTKASISSGINNISFDIMLGIQGQTCETLKSTLDFCLKCNVTHISAYILKIEPGTTYYINREFLNLPSEDEVCNLYLYCCDYLKKNGFIQYEISNFSRPGFESKHNLKYWNCDEYLGIGPAAHSYIEGVRFYVEPNVSNFINGSYEIKYESENKKLSQKEAMEEYIMMKLRLKEGISNSEFRKKFDVDLPYKYIKRAEDLKNTGLINFSLKSISLTSKGFLVSNSIISKILFGV